MPRPCTVCQHRDRAAIDAALVAGAPVRAVASRYVPLSAMAVQRHKDAHLPATLTKAAEAAEVAHADTLLAQLRDLQRRTLTILTVAERGEDYPTALKAIGEARRNLELLAKLLGELDERAVINVLVAPEWVALRGRIVVALAAFPEARVALAGVLDAG